MDVETSSHIHQVGIWVYDHFAVIGLFAGGVIGAALWAWRQYMSQFATVKAVRELRHENVIQHQEIKNDMASNHAEVLKTIIEKHNG